MPVQSRREGDSILVDSVDLKRTARSFLRMTEQPGWAPPKDLSQAMEIMGKCMGIGLLNDSRVESTMPRLDGDTRPSLRDHRLLVTKPGGPVAAGPALALQFMESMGQGPCLWVGCSGDWPLSFLPSFAKNHIAYLGVTFDSKGSLNNLDVRFNNVVGVIVGLEYSDSVQLAYPDACIARHKAFTQLAARLSDAQRWAAVIVSDVFKLDLDDVQLWDETLPSFDRDGSTKILVHSAPTIRSDGSQADQPAKGGVHPWITLGDREMAEMTRFPVSKPDHRRRASAHFG